MLLRKVTRTCQRTIAANDDQGVNLFPQTGLIGFLSALNGHELLAAGTLQDGAALGDDTADILITRL
jgi:hypothetical protein